MAALFSTAPAVATSGAAGAATGWIRVGCSPVVLVATTSGMRAAGVTGLGAAAVGGSAATAVVVATCGWLMGTGATVKAADGEAAASVLTGTGTTCWFPALPTTTVAVGKTIV